MVLFSNACRGNQFWICSKASHYKPVLILSGHFFGDILHSPFSLPSIHYHTARQIAHIKNLSASFDVHITIGQEWKWFPKLSICRSRSGNGTMFTTTSCTKRVAEIAECINNLQCVFPQCDGMARAAFSRSGETMASVTP